jgi:hypothetical protein
MLEAQMSKDELAVIDVTAHLERLRDARAALVLPDVYDDRDALTASRLEHAILVAESLRERLERP